MKKILSLMVIASFALTACGENTETSVNEEQVTTAVEEQATPVMEEQATPAVDKPRISSSQTTTVTAIVEAINHETREVSLRKQDDTVVSFVASEDARNLDQVQVGDVVVAQYEERLDIRVISVENAQAEVAEASVAARTEKGEMPGMAVMNTVVITATVEEINLEANTFKLKGPKGNIKEYVARDPENLKKAAVGDLVVITYSEAIALTVEKAE